MTIIFPTVDPGTSKIPPTLIPNAVPNGGGAGQVLAKTTGADGSFGWVTPTGGSGGGTGAGLQSTVWFFPGNLTARTSGAALVMPPYGTFELIGASLLVQAAGVSVTGNSVVRFTAEGSVVGQISLGPTELQSRGWHKGSSDPAKQIFATAPTLSPESVIRCEILQVPSGSGTLPQNLSAQLWWKWTG